jgi:ribosomal protein S18 acetylase RimI-like enzyme
LPVDGYLIRPATAADEGAVFSLVEQLGGEVEPPERAAFGSAFAHVVGVSDDHLLLVATDESGVVVGYAMTTLDRLLYTKGDSAQLQELVVDEQVRGSGIGSMLVEAVEEECRARGVRQLTAASSRGASFYERLDYRSTADYLKKNFEE